MPRSKHDAGGSEALIFDAIVCIQSNASRAVRGDPGAYLLHVTELETSREGRSICLKWMQFGVAYAFLVYKIQEAKPFSQVA